MDLSMDGLRTSMSRSYNRLADFLNDCNNQSDPDYSYIEVNRKELTELMQKLKQDIGISLCVYDDKQKDFNLLYDKINLIDFNGD